MMNNSTETNITEFRNWLLTNRTNLQNSLRKFKAAKSYFVIVSLGCIIFSAHAIYNSKEHYVAGILGILICGIVLAFSGKVSEFISGLKGFSNLPVYSNEKNEYWLSSLPSITGTSHSLLSNIFVKKAVKDSGKRSINLFIFFSALIVISDAVKDEIKTPD